MVTLSPPVSPSVVARILMIQKPRVTAGTLLSQPPAAVEGAVGAELPFVATMSFLSLCQLKRDGI
jgi:hypothetical protein